MRFDISIWPCRAKLAAADDQAGLPSFVVDRLCSAYAAMLCRSGASAVSNAVHGCAAACSTSTRGVPVQMLHAIAEELAALDRSSRVALTAIVLEAAPAVLSGLIAVLAGEQRGQSQASAVRAVAAWLALVPGESTTPVITPGETMSPLC